LLICCAAILTIVLFLSLIRWVSVPLQVVSTSLDRQDPKLLAGLARDRAEFGQLAVVIQRFFAQKDELVREIAERKRAEEQLRHDAFHDALSGLANRALFMDRLTNAMARARRWEESAFAVMFIDLDRFKVTNDSLGHLIGDQLLCAVSRRLVRCVRAGDLVARLGGDEFAILLESVRDAETPIMIAERIQEELELAFEINGHEVFTSASIGIALSSSAYDRPEELVRDADTAMYQAKTLGKARHVVFHDALGSQVMTLMSLENDLRRAIERGELRVHYQPMVSLPSGRVIGLEALVRWQHPERGLLPAAEFVPVAEESGLISTIDHWVLREACLCMRVLDQRADDKSHLLLAVNVSSKQFSQPGLVSRIERTLVDTGFDPRRLRLEITESAIIENAEAAAKALGRLNALGIQLCLDDFGTGYSSLSYLHQLPVDSLKIDRRFSSRMVEDGDFEIVRTIVLLARKLGMKVVAEGVETTEQLTRLRALECQFAQGYLFSRPLDSDALEAFLDARTEDAATSDGTPNAERAGVDGSLLVL
jgi:diguanylate cyclase (GGDEF)-like protein